MWGLVSGEESGLEVRESEGKGLGVFTTKSFMRGEYVAEYKTQEVYSRKEKKDHEEEYILNEEGCYVLEAKFNERWWCFDATRRFEQFGRYINHSSSKEANVRPHGPVSIRKKLRVGFLAVRDIAAGEELQYDYGCSPNGIEWLKRHKKHTEV